jgi:hypothetical protein
MDHKPEIVPGSLKRNDISGGIEFRMTCCGKLETSVHIQNLAAFEDHDQRMRVVQSYLDELKERHQAEHATHEFLKTVFPDAGEGDCGCK